MTAHIDGLRLRKIMGRDEWLPPEPYNGIGWSLRHRTGDGSVIVSISDPREPWGAGWIHASMTRKTRVPDYDDLVRLHQAAFPGGYAYHVFAPPRDHININPHALHLWGRLDGTRVLPDFGAFGTI